MGGHTQISHTYRAIMKLERALEDWKYARQVFESIQEERVNTRVLLM
jgi:hypothetical protein